MDAELSRISSDFVTTVVLHDDVIPRLTPTSIRNLLKHLMYVKQTWVDQHFEKDLVSVVDRARKVWAPRFRGSFVLPRREVKRNSKEKGPRRQPKTRGINFEDDFLKNVEGIKCSGTQNTDSLLESSDEENENVEQPPQQNAERLAESWSEVPFDEPPRSSDTLVEESTHYDAPLDKRSDAADNVANPNDVDAAGRSSPVVLSETPLTRMYIPGRILHIYTDDGAYKARFVPRGFKEIRRISLAGNMLTDHTARAYYEALLEVKSVRKAEEKGVLCPKWVSFEESSSW